MNPLNVLILTIDALRADHLRCYGYPRATSPHIDAMADHGVVFERAAAQWPKTGPSMASFMMKPRVRIGSPISCG